MRHNWTRPGNEPDEVVCSVCGATAPCPNDEECPGESLRPEQREVAEWCEGIVRQWGYREASGTSDFADWYDTQACSLIDDAARRLVELGLWEPHPRNRDSSRRNWYRPTGGEQHE